ncbi:hypothetical protein [Antarcticirhabdus aurantiaca]|uniref:Uncharacterized protein n=1 Tax=Antarcticirhabdus aurantiaca TaxID=2606717 RepID=A0ACD4NKA1_9HYPH|nr:hypothetical protein [Antarcticirhabdus aurantiaca]WAJ27216.1 hypothetical protein OXU80_20515 [Jeongeuplla avenae]
MTARMTVLEIVAVLAGAVIGTLVLDFATWLLADGTFLSHFASPAWLVLALVTVALYALLYHKLPATPAVLGSFFIGILVPSVIVKLGFDSVLSWSTLFMLHAIFSLASLATYRFVHANAAVRKAVGEATDASR